jgi:hypothetical protein
MKCPGCGAALDVQLILDTNCEKISNMKLSNQQTQTLNWKQSTKRPALSTILVTPELLRSPAANQLYNNLRMNPNRAIKEGDITFKLSKLENGTEFFQKWQPIKEER